MKYHYGVIAQLVERVLSMHEALGSTPSNSIFFILFFTHSKSTKLFNSSFPFLLYQYKFDKHKFKNISKLIFKKLFFE